MPTPSRLALSCLRVGLAVCVIAALLGVGAVVAGIISGDAAAFALARRELMIALPVVAGAGFVLLTIGGVLMLLRLR